MRYAIVSWYIVDDHRHFGNRHSQRSRNVVATHLVAAATHLLIQNQVPESGVIKKAGSCPQNAFQRAQVTNRQQSKRERRAEGGEDKFIEGESESRRVAKVGNDHPRKKAKVVNLLVNVHS